MFLNKPTTVVHVSSAHPYTDNRVHYRECNSLVEAGYDVTLVAVESSVLGPPSDVKIITIPKRKRLARMLLSSFEAVHAAYKTKAKIVHMHDPELIPFIPLLRLAGRYVIYDAHEDLPTQVINKSYLKPRVALLISVFAKVIVRVACMSNMIVAATETIALRYPGRKSIIVHNYPPLRAAEAESVDAGFSMRSETLVYVGGFSHERGANAMVRAMSDPEMPEGWRLHIAGTIPEPLLDEMKSQEGWGRVDFEGQVAPDIARDIILKSRVGLVLFSDTLAHRDALPTKMFEYFAAGVPVIASDFPLWRTIVEENQSGILVSPESPQEVATAIRKYADDPELLRRHSQNARDLAVKSLNWEPESKILVGGYQRLINT